MEKYTFKISNNTNSEKQIILFGGKQKFSGNSTVFDDKISIECEPKPYEKILDDFYFMGIVRKIKCSRSIQACIKTEDLIGNRAQRDREYEKNELYEQDIFTFAINPFTTFEFLLAAKTKISITISVDIKQVYPAKVGIGF